MKAHLKKIFSLLASKATLSLAVMLGVGILGGITGCVNMGGDYGSVVTEGQKSSIVKGKTSKIEILRELGNPDQKIDLGNGKEQFSYIKETIKSSGNPFTMSTGSTYNEFWILFDNGIVSDFGERPTTKAPNYFKGN